MGKTELDIIREESKALGVLQKINYDNSHNEFLEYAVLYNVKESKKYKTGGLTWKEFCESLGKSVRTVDSVLQDITPLIERFSASFADLSGLNFSKIRSLGRSISADSAEIENESIIINDKAISLNPDNKDEIESAIDSLVEQHKREKKLLSKLKEPNLDNLIPELKEMLDNGNIMPAVARNYSQLTEEGQKIQASAENGRIMALSNLKQLEAEKADLEKSVTDKAHKLAGDLKKNLRLEIEEAHKEVAQAKLDIKKQLEESIRSEVERKYQKDLDKAEKAQRKAEKDAKQARESMAAAHKKSNELENETEQLKKQVEMSNPTQVDNKWASLFYDQGKHLHDYIEMMKSEMDMAGGYPEHSIQALNDLLKSVNTQLDILEGNAIIDIKKGA